MIISIWNCFSIPVDIAFEPPAFNTTLNDVVNHFIDALFAIDILLNFRTAYTVEATGLELSEPRQIAINYLKGRFIIDILATVPFDSIFQGFTENGVSGQLAVLSLLKFFRVLRVTKVISYINASENIKHSLKIFKLLFFLVIYIHFQACAWFYYTNIDKVWYPLEKVLLNQRNFYDDDVSILYKYCFSVYCSVNILLGEEMMPVT